MSSPAVSAAVALPRDFNDLFNKALDLKDVVVKGLSVLDMAASLYIHGLMPQHSVVNSAVWLASRLLTIKVNDQSHPALKIAAVAANALNIYMQPDLSFIQQSFLSDLILSGQIDKAYRSRDIALSILNMVNIGLPHSSNRDNSAANRIG